MKIHAFNLKNYRRLADVTLVLGEKRTILVGANNSGKTSCIGALHTFLKNPDSMRIRDISKRNWREIQEIGNKAEKVFPKTEELQGILKELVELLPNLDIKISANASEAYKVRDILPNLEWCGEKLSVRITYEPKDILKLLSDYVDARKVVSKHKGKISLWPKDLCDFLEKSKLFNAHIKQKHYVLSEGDNILGEDILQPLKSDILKKLIRVDVISEQRGLGSDDHGDENGPYSEKQRLNKLLRDYYDRILNPEESPEAGDLAVLEQQQDLELEFTDRLNKQFEDPFAELKGMGYPGIGGNPTVEIAAKISGIDALQKSSSVRYRFDKNDEEFIPESYLGLGYQNLIYLTFRLLKFRDTWMRVGKVSSSEKDLDDQIEPIHLVLVEEPEVNLHAQVQKVFISKAYNTLRNHKELRDKLTQKDKDQYSTQLVISTHSSHIIDNIDFKDLRYFKRTDANQNIKMDHSSIKNMSELFSKPKEEMQFVRKHLKLTHCDIFFADGVIFVEGQAERLLIPEFIANNHPALEHRYISILEVSGAHSHKYRELIEKLGVATLVLTDVDSIDTNGISCFPKLNSNQRSNNDTLRMWHPKLEQLDDLMSLPKDGHIALTSSSPLYIAFQRSTKVSGKEVLSRTFEDALIAKNLNSDHFQGKAKLKAAKASFDSGSGVLELSLYEYVKSLNKGSFAFDCLFYLSDEASPKLEPPEYIKFGLEWLEAQLSPAV